MSHQEETATKASNRQDDMKVLDYHRVASHTYEVVTESARRGRITRRVLVLPSGAMSSAADGSEDVTR